MIKLDLGAVVTIGSWIVAIGWTLLKVFIAALCIDSYIVDRVNKKDIQWKDFMFLFAAVLIIL